MDDVERPHKGLSPLADGLWFIADAAFALAQQEGMGVEGRHDLNKRMSECARLPVEHPHHLRTRHLQSKLPKKHTDEVGLTTGVYPADVNGWLGAINAPYQWTPDCTLRDQLVAQRTVRAKLSKKPMPPPPEVPLRSTFSAGVALDMIGRRKRDEAAVTVAVSKGTSPGPARACDESQQIEDAGVTKRERQIRAIITMARTQGIDPLQVPTGKKSELMYLCKQHHPALFGAGDDPFKDAWKAAGSNRLSMADRKKFSGR